MLVRDVRNYLSTIIHFCAHFPIFNSLVFKSHNLIDSMAHSLIISSTHRLVSPQYAPLPKRTTGIVAKIISRSNKSDWFSI